jgi:hypothetical protein
MCADDELHPSLFHFIRITGQLFHIALYLLILERISQVARTADTNISGAIQVFLCLDIVMFSSTIRAWIKFVF